MPGTKHNCNFKSFLSQTWLLKYPAHSQGLAQPSLAASEQQQLYSCPVVSNLGKKGKKKKSLILDPWQRKSIRAAQSCILNQQLITSLNFTNRLKMQPEYFSWECFLREEMLSNVPFPHKNMPGIDKQNKQTKPPQHFILNTWTTQCILNLFKKISFGWQNIQ